MYIRTDFNEDESIDTGSIGLVMEAKKVFLGSIHGVAITNRGIGDNHVQLTLLTCDDDYWRICDGRKVYSSSWIEEEILLLAEVKKWCEENCVPDTVFNGKQYGWRFK